MSAIKTALLLLGLAICPAFAQLGGTEHIIKQRAKDLSNQNNARQGVPPPGQAGQPGPAPPPPPSPEQLSLSRFQVGLAAIKADEPPTAEKKQQLVANLSGAAQAPKPAAEAVKKLVDDLTAALAEKPLPPDKRAKFIQEIDAVLNPVKYPQAKLPAIYDDIQATFQVNGLPRKDALKLVEDIKNLSPSAQTATK